MAIKAFKGSQESLISSPRTKLMERVCSDKLTLMELFDYMFGHNGYSGIAF